MENIKRFEINTEGIDYACTDVHGTFSQLEAKLIEINFNFNADRLFLGGDLVDRGPENEKVLEWLAKPYVHSIMGNHEEMAIHYTFGTADPSMYICNGGSWFIKLSREQQEAIANRFKELPYVMEIETALGTIGMVHADPIFENWGDLIAEFDTEDVQQLEQITSAVTWTRDLVYEHDVNHKGVYGVRAVICGHTPLDVPKKIGNVHFIDTGACFREGRTTIMRLDTLEVV